MENQHRQIKGYRELSQEEIDLMNEIKQQGAALGALVQKLRNYVPTNMEGPAGGEAEAFKPGATLDQRWVSIGETHLQTGLMALTRAVAQPTFF
jgi:hypothetical protein